MTMERTFRHPFSSFVLPAFLCVCKTIEKKKKKKGGGDERMHRD